MSSKYKYRARKSLSFRIALFYSLIYILSSFFAFTGFYIIISSNLNKDINEDMLSDVRELEILLENEGFEMLVDEINKEAEADGFENSFFRIFSLDGRILAETQLQDWDGLNIEEDIIRDIFSGVKDPYRIISFTLPGKEYHVRTIYSLIGSEYILQIGLVLEEVNILLILVRNTFLLLVVIIVFPSALIALLTARRALSGVETVSQTAREISESGSLDRRVEVESSYDEISQLADTFNTMLNSIQILVTGLKEINENIAHDLQTPITRIRGHAEVTLTSGKSTILDYKNMASNTVEESDRLLEIITSMLYISKADAGIAATAKEEMDLCEIVRIACELFSPIAEDKGISINLDIPESCTFYGEQNGIQRLIANLLDNAIKYSPHKGQVSIEILKTNTDIFIKIKDTGIGISSEKIKYIFKRFYRCHENTDIPGIGLGLSLVQAIVKHHSGTIEVESTKGCGSTFNIRLPLK